jgi:hypothetical protein
METSVSNGEPRNAGAWAPPIKKLVSPGVPASAINLNVDGRQSTGPLQGFGQLWQKTYQVRLSGVAISPQEVVKLWREHFGDFWPKGNGFYGPLTRIEPGEVAVLNLAMPVGMKLSTGVHVIYADEESFSFMTPEGHIYAAMITFSAYTEDNATVAQVQPLLRANDPLYELGMRMGIVHKVEDEFWRRTLESLAARFGVPNAQVRQKNMLVDPRLQWHYAKNLWHNAAIRTFFYRLLSPLRWIRHLFSRNSLNR